MEDEIAVSVAITFYNQEKFINETLESVLIQKTTFNYEIVIGEDSSSDNSKKILNEYQKHYPRKIRVLYNQKNLGLVLNTKNILDNCRGKYIALLDGDDLFCNENKLQMQYDFLEKNPDYGVVHSDAKLLIEDKKHAVKLYKSADDFYSKTPWRKVKCGNVFEDLILDNFIIPCTSLFRRELYVRHVDFEEYHRLGFKMQDLPMWLQISRFSKFGYINEPLSIYRQSQNSLSRSNNEDKSLNFWKSYMDACDYFIRRYDLGIETKNKFYRKYHLFNLNYAFHFRDYNLALKSTQYFKDIGDMSRLYNLYLWGSHSIINWFFVKILRKLCWFFRINLYLSKVD